jgi:hypothetical protein
MARLYTEKEVQRLIQEATAPLLVRIAQLEAELAKLKRDSSTSSKPPSSDIVKPPRPRIQGRKGRKRKPRRGGQPGHLQHQRTPFPPEEVGRIWIYEWPEASLTSDWKPRDEFRTIQQVDLVPQLFEVTEHRARVYRHRLTGERITAPLPEEVTRAGLVGPRLSALIAYQKGACHMTYRVIQTFLDDVLALKLSTGQLAKVAGKASAALVTGYQQLQMALPARRMVHVDETGHPENGQQLWSWGFQMPADRWQRAAQRAQRDVLKVARRPPCRSEAQNIAGRFQQHAEHYFRFLKTPGVEPTNNAMEQRFRFVVIDRKITQGTRGETGRRWCERIWTVLATCPQQRRSAFEFLYGSIVAYLRSEVPPCLLPAPP